MPEVVFVPGLPGSKLRVRKSGGGSKRIWLPGIAQMAPSVDPALMRRLKAPDDLADDDGVYAGVPIRSAAKFLGFDLMKQADSLYAFLEEIGVAWGDIVRFGWDWRRPVTDDALPPGTGGFPGSAVIALKNLLQGLGQPATVIVHSTGGLLLRHCLESDPGLVAKVERIIAFGVPWGGTLKSLAVLIGRQGFGPVSPLGAQEIFAYGYAAADLLPRAAGTGLVVDAHGAEVDLLAGAKDWTRAIPNDGAGLLGAAMRSRCDHSIATLGTPTAAWTLPIDVINIVGWGKKTLVKAVLQGDDTIALDPGDLDNENGHSAEDGCAATDERVYQGDGTVPVASAAWLTGSRVTTFYLPIGALRNVGLSNQRHSALWRNPGARRLLVHHLAGLPFTACAYAAVDWSHKVNPTADPIRVRYVMQAPDGSPLAGAAPRVRTTTGTVEGTVDATGRGLFELARDRFPLTQGGRFRRVAVELAWGGEPNPDEQAMFIEP